MRYSLRRALIVSASGLAVAAVSLTMASTDGVKAQSTGLEGSWSGGGQIVFPSGEAERARCRASFRRQGGDSFGMSAICATPSARVKQSAEVTRVTGNRYRGEFFNQEYGLSGSIRIVVEGDNMHASLSGGGGSAQLSMNR